MTSSNTSPQDWMNRIVRYGVMAADQFTANPRNPRRHPQAQRDAVKGSLDTLGFIAPVIINRVSGYLIDGHERVMQALGQGDDTPVPFIEVDLTEDEEAIALASFDWITYMATYDQDTLSDLLRDIDTDNQAMQALLDQIASENNITLDDAPVMDDQGAEIDKGAELAQRYGTATGQIWQLGRHRLAIGDSTDKAVIAALMGGRKADLIVSDPPYNLAENWNGLQSLRGNTQVANDSNANFETWFMSWLNAWLPHIEQEAAFYLWHSPHTHIRLLIEKSGFTVHASIVWVKEHFNIGRADYHSQYESCLYFSRGDRYWCGRRDLSDVWHANRVEQERVHPTQKPLSLISLSIENSSEKNALVVDPFLGSGTTLIAAHQTGRICYGCEISPDYAAVCIQRWETMTGQTAALLTPRRETHEIEF